MCIHTLEYTHLSCVFAKQMMIGPCTYKKLLCCEQRKRTVSRLQHLRYLFRKFLPQHG